MVSGLESEGEIRALSAEEREAFDKKEAEIKDIDATIERVERRRAEKMGSRKYKICQFLFPFFCFKRL